MLILWMPMVISLLWKCIGRSRTYTGKLTKQKHTFLFQRSILFTITANWLPKRTAILNCISNSARLWRSSFYVNVLQEDSGSIWVNQAEFLEELTVFKASSQTPWNLGLTMRLATPSHLSWRAPAFWCGGTEFTWMQIQESGQTNQV